MLRVTGDSDCATPAHPGRESVSLGQDLNKTKRRQGAESKARLLGDSLTALVRGYSDTIFICSETFSVEWEIGDYLQVADCVTVNISRILSPIKTKHVLLEMPKEAKSTQRSVLCMFKCT